MESGFTRFLDNDPVPLGRPSQLIRASTAPLLRAPATPAGEPGVRQPFVNERLNSRLESALGSFRSFTLEWKSSLPREIEPQWVLQADDRIFVLGASNWQMFDGAGSFVRRGMLHLGGVTLDPERALFYLPDVAGPLGVHRLASGEAAFHLPLISGKHSFRSFVARRGRFLVSVSTDVPVDLHGPEPENSRIEVVDMSDAKALAADLNRKTNLLLAALHGDSVVLATGNSIYFANMDLDIRAALSGSFLPLAMSLDEGGLIYLVVHTEGKSELWLLGEDGSRYFSFVLPVRLTRAYPPILGYDHTAYLLAGDHILAVAPDGRLEWSRAAAGALIGAVVTADDFLLVTEGNEVAAYDSEGERRALFSSAGEPLTTPPILTSDGDLLVASSAALYCLTPREAPAPVP